MKYDTGNRARRKGQKTAVIVAVTVRRPDAQPSYNLACAAISRTGGWRAHQAAGEVEPSATSAIGVVVERLPDSEDILRTEVGSLLGNYGCVAAREPVAGTRASKR